jgi:hypothetical protein
MSNLVIKNPLVRGFSLDFLDVMWEIEDTFLDPHDFLMYVYRSESPMGPWDLVAGPFEDRYRFVDNRVNLQARWRILYYKIKSVEKIDPTNVMESDPFWLEGDPDLIAAEIQRLERLLWEEYAGRRCFIFPARTFGQHCPNCFEGPDKGKGYSSQRRRSQCLTCYDTGFVRGYFDPIEIFIQIDPSPKSVQTLPITERQQNDTTARLPNFPLMKPRDIIVEAENIRWRVVQVTATERLRSVVHQELRLHEIVKGDIEFQLPVRIADLRNFEPSPGRNYTDPQNLESFEQEAIKNVFGIYGYGRR